MFSQPESDGPPRTTCYRERFEKESLSRHICCLLLLLLLLLLCYSWHDGIIMTGSNPSCMQKEVWRLKRPEAVGIFCIVLLSGLDRFWLKWRDKYSKEMRYDEEGGGQLQIFQGKFYSGASGKNPPRLVLRSGRQPRRFKVTSRVPSGKACLQWPDKKKE